MPPCASLLNTYPSLSQPIAILPQVLLCSTPVVIHQHQHLEQHVNTKCATMTSRCTNSCKMSCCTQAKCSKHHTPSPRTSLTPPELLQQLLCCPPCHLLTSMHTCTTTPPPVLKCSTDGTTPPLSWAQTCWCSMLSTPSQCPTHVYAACRAC